MLHACIHLLSLLRYCMFLMQAIKFSEEHSHGSLVALAIAIIAIFAAVNFNKVISIL